MAEENATPLPPAQEEQPIVMPYWSQNEFHERLKTVPFKQADADGTTVVNVNHFYFKMIGKDLVSAMVPEDLTLPTEWEIVEDLTSPLPTKALSMLGKEPT